jgi:hypothetical protein
MWHDAMVAHERRLRAGRAGDVCDEECPHGEAAALWAKAVTMFGERAHGLPFLRSRAINPTRGSDFVRPQLAAPRVSMSGGKEVS